MVKKSVFIFVAFILYGVVSKAQPSIIDKPTEWKPNTTVLMSENKEYRLIYQSDGNLVVYDKKDKPLWNSKTNGKKTERLVFQSDGNLVIYGSKNKVYWASNTYKDACKFLRLNDFGSLSIWSATSHIWYTGKEPSNKMIENPNAPRYTFIGGGQGTVKFYNNAKGFGFIEQANGGKDVFFTKEYNQKNSLKIKDGDHVEYDLVDGPKGVCAVNVQIL